MHSAGRTLHCSCTSSKIVSGITIPGTHFDGKFSTAVFLLNEEDEKLSQELAASRHSESKEEKKETRARRSVAGGIWISQGLRTNTRVRRV